MIDLEAFKRRGITNVVRSSNLKRTAVTFSYDEILDFEQHYVLVVDLTPFGDVHSNILRSRREETHVVQYPLPPVVAEFRDAWMREIRERQKP